MVDLRKFEIIWIDAAEADLERLPLSLQSIAVRKLEDAVMRQFKGAERLRQWPGEYRRIKIDDSHRLVFHVDRSQMCIVVLSIDPRKNVYDDRNKEKLQRLLESWLQVRTRTQPLVRADYLTEQLPGPGERKG
mgnify:CR=1 FL=1